MRSSRTIVIAGAGIGGLTCALALAARGFHVTLLEKAELLEEVGAGLQLSPNASRVLIDLGLAPMLATKAVTPETVSIMTARSGGEVMRLPLASRAHPDAPYWLVHRADLQGALLAAVQSHPDIDLRLAAPVQDIVATDIVRVGDLEASALVGADGAWSAVRAKTFPSIQPQFSGLMAWRGTCDAANLPADLRPTGIQLWMGPRAHLVVYPMSAGTRINMVAIIPGEPLAPGWNAPGARDDIDLHFSRARWPANARAMIAAIDNWGRWPLYTMPDGGAWHSGRIALIGDAAHAMLPFAAQGAGMAIEDATTLAQCLGETESNDELPAALARYTALRRPRVTRVQRTARQQGQIYHLQGPMAFARDTVMRLLGPRRLQARQDWIYHWRL
ncbi:FAD-dependent oxidoreductase [Rhodopseudomonas boonkerdii]|uniref:FAD-dependent monooxygenase n=1 Tax=Rhodopseudomonas boonkerdii TaxID=475937 RepID=UPI001E3DE2CE|nr:FAD-dependent monooxygenase [Rhodopseudomonas boonkerdii]UGV27314.1 FAD-dependent oxidoreductase [Rhodopseudomonas boonkerdii]